MDTILFFTTSSARGGALRHFVGAQAEAVRRGIHLQMVEGTPSAKRVAELAGLWHPLGAIVNCNGEWGDLDPSLFGPMPAVLLGHSPETLPPGTLSVRHDSYETGRTAARELLATGYRIFAFVPPIQRRYWSETRQNAFVETIRLHGFPCHVMENAGNSTEDSVWQRHLRAFLLSLPKPCALFAATDIHGVEVLAAARFCGIDVPGELAVLGVDNNEEMCERAVPPLSSIEPDYHRAGMLAVQAIVGRVGQPPSRPPKDSATDADQPVRDWVYGDLRVVRRASTRPLASHDTCAARALELIRNKACSGLRPANVAAIFPCSRRMADLRFRKAVGHSIGEEIHAVQLDMAKQLASDSGRQLKSIAEFCGFASPGALRTFFRRETGMSLTAWRRSVTGSRRTSTGLRTRA